MLVLFQHIFISHHLVFFGMSLKGGKHINNLTSFNRKLLLCIIAELWLAKLALLDA